MKARDWLDAKGWPSTDEIDLKPSLKRFPRGGQYGVEMPVVNDMKTLELTTKLLREEGVYCTRFNETHGSHLLSDQEIGEMLALARSHGCGYVFGLGPRPEYDVKASFYRTEFGMEMGRQINNNDALRWSIDEALRLVELGCRGLIVYDVGVLRVLKALRDDDLIPADVVLKTSSHCMASNPMLAQIFRENGADSITTTHDLGLPVLAEMRRLAGDLVLDIPTDVYKTKGGYIRFFELAEFVRCASPVFLKMGASAQGHPYESTNEQTVYKRVRRVKRGQEMLEKYAERAFARISPADRHVALAAL